MTWFPALALALLGLIYFVRAILPPVAAVTAMGLAVAAWTAMTVVAICLVAFWAVWWCFDRKGALEGFRAATTRRRRKILY